MCTIHGCNSQRPLPYTFFIIKNLYNQTSNICTKNTNAMSTFLHIMFVNSSALWQRNMKITRIEILNQIAFAELCGYFFVCRITICNIVDFNFRRCKWCLLIMKHHNFLVCRFWLWSILFSHSHYTLYCLIPLCFSFQSYRKLQLHRDHLLQG